MLAAALLAMSGWTIPACAMDASADADFTFSAVSLRVPKPEMVSFAAIPNDDTVAGEPGSMLYAGPPAAALVGVIAHGIIASR
jgi:hypothetical protein